MGVVEVPLKVTLSTMLKPPSAVFAEQDGYTQVQGRPRQAMEKGSRTITLRGTIRPCKAGGVRCWPRGRGRRNADHELPLMKAGAPTAGAARWVGRGRGQDGRLTGSAVEDGAVDAREAARQVVEGYECEEHLCVRDGRRDA